MRVYVDTNVFMDFLGNRNSNAFKFFVKAISCMHSIVLSDVVITELEFQEVQFRNLLKILKEKIELTHATKEDKMTAKNLPTHYNDALHICIAERLKVDAIITRNKKDFTITNIPIKYADEV